MLTLESIKQEFQPEGINGDHIEYAVSAIKEGTRRELIMENLIEQRHLDITTSCELLDRLYQWNGGEFKVENKNGYVMGIFSLMAGVGLWACSVFLFFNEGALSKVIATVVMGAILIFYGIVILATAFRGKYRDEMDLFKEEI
ncbi:MAG: hypothetical protein V4722_27580 [Bacteroidota bacterium]